MDKKKRVKQTKKAEKALDRSAASPPRKTKPTTGREARSALVKAVFGADTEAGASLATDLLKLADGWPEDFEAAMKMLAKVGNQLGQVLEEGGPFARQVAKPVMAYRQRIIAELGSQLLRSSCCSTPP